LKAIINKYNVFIGEQRD